MLNPIKTYLMKSSSKGETKEKTSLCYWKYIWTSVGEIFGFQIYTFNTCIATAYYI